MRPSRLAGFNQPVSPRPDTIQDQLQPGLHLVHEPAGQALGRPFRVVHHRQRRGPPPEGARSPRPAARACRHNRSRSAARSAGVIDRPGVPARPSCAAHPPSRTGPPPARRAHGPLRTPGRRAPGARLGRWRGRAGPAGTARVTPPGRGRSRHPDGTTIRANPVRHRPEPKRPGAGGCDSRGSGRGS